MLEIIFFYSISVLLDDDQWKMTRMKKEIEIKSEIALELDLHPWPSESFICVMNDMDTSSVFFLCQLLCVSVAFRMYHYQMLHGKR